MMKAKMCFGSPDQIVYLAQFFQFLQVPKSQKHCFVVSVKIQNLHNLLGLVIKVQVAKK